jgi:hypothetical protein
MALNRGCRPVREYTGGNGLRCHRGVGAECCTELKHAQDQNVYYFYEVYRDEAALEAHRAAPHFAVWQVAADTLDGTPEATRCQTVFPAAAGYWERK